MSSKTPWRTLWRLITKCALPMHLEAWNFAKSFWNVYLCCTRHPKSPWLHSGIKNVLTDVLIDALETHRRISSSSSPRDLKVYTELSKGLFMSFLILQVQHLLDSILESRMSSKTPWRTQINVGLLDDEILTRYWHMVLLVANFGIIAIYQSFQVGFLGWKRDSLTLFNPV